MREAAAGGGEPLASSLEGRLARALAMGQPAFMRRARALEDLEERLHAGLAAERWRLLGRLRRPARVLEAALQASAELPGPVREALAALRAVPPPPGAQPLGARGSGAGASGAERSSPPTARPLRSLERAAREFEKRVAAFNERWRAHLERLDLGEIRRAQAGYNRYNPIERELALPGAPLLRFRELPLLEREDLLRRYPPLPA